jgi:hypothetical protein
LVNDAKQILPRSAWDSATPKKPFRRVRSDSCRGRHAHTPTRQATIGVVPSGTRLQTFRNSIKLTRGRMALRISRIWDVFSRRDYRIQPGVLSLENIQQKRFALKGWEIRWAKLHSECHRKGIGYLLVQTALNSVPFNPGQTR